MFKDDELIEVYTEGNSNMFLPTMVKNGAGYVLDKPNENGEVIPSYVTWGDIKYINKLSSVFKTGMIRFEESIEEEALGYLKIKLKNNKEYYTVEKIREMILENDNIEGVIKEILEITNINIINRLASELVALENTNEYNISSQIALYVKSRQEELMEGTKKTELPKPTIKNAGKAKPKGGKGKGKGKEEDLDKEENN